MDLPSEPGTSPTLAEAVDLKLGEAYALLSGVESEVVRAASESLDPVVSAVQDADGAVRGSIALLLDPAETAVDRSDAAIRKQISDRLVAAIPLLTSAEQAILAAEADAPPDPTAVGGPLVQIFDTPPADNGTPVGVPSGLPGGGGDDPPGPCTPGPSGGFVGGEGVYEPGDCCNPLVPPHASGDCCLDTSTGQLICPSTGGQDGGEEPPDDYPDDCPPPAPCPEPIVCPEPEVCDECPELPDWARCLVETFCEKPRGKAVGPDYGTYYASTYNMLFYRQ